jgi:hypothetical protein
MAAVAVAVAVAVPAVLVPVASVDVLREFAVAAVPVSLEHVYLFFPD